MATKQVAAKKRATRHDGLVNVITGLGTIGKDKTVGNRFAVPNLLLPGELESIYRGNGIGRRIIDLPIGEMTREWFEVDGDPDGLCLGYLENLHAKAAIQDGLRWADLYGGSLIMLGLDDGEKNLALPLSEARLRGVKFLHVYDRWQVTWSTTDLEQDTTKPLYNQPLVYRVTPYGGTQFMLHESRTLKFVGAPVPPRAQRELQFWGDPMLQAAYEQLRNAAAGDSHTAALLEEWAIGVLTIKNLVSLLAAKDGEAKVARRLEIIDYGKHILRSMVLAEGETFEKKTQAISGLADVLDRQAQRLSAATAIPVTLLFGEPPTGLRANGVENRKNWYDEIAARQEVKLLPALERLVRYVYISKDGPTKGAEPANWKVQFKPLDQPTQTEEATNRKMTADTDVAYITAGVLDPEEVAISRFGGNRYSTETTIDPAAHVATKPEASPEPPPAKPNGTGVPTVQ